MAEANAIPLNPSMEHVPMRSTPEVDVYEIGYDSLDGLRIAGWYCRPKESYLKPPYPALLIVPGYVSEPTLPKSWAKMGYAAVGVAPRGKLRSNRHYNPGYPGLLTHGPLQALAMAEAARSRCGLAGTGLGYEYRLVAPLFDHQGLIARAVPEDGRIRTSVRDKSGRTTAHGTIA